MSSAEHHVFVFAHPDDEFACSGIIADLVEIGANVHCIYLTDGGFGGQSSERRMAESEAALALLGLTASHIHPLGVTHGFRDGALHETMPQAKQAVLREINVIAPRASGPLTLHLPAWEGGHQDHDACHAIGVAAGRELGADMLQFPLYCGKGLPGPLFFVNKPIPENGAVLKCVRLGLRQRLSAISLCFKHRSQWKSWVGLLPFFASRMLLFGHFSEQGVEARRALQRPHAGALLYERRGGPSYGEVASAVADLLNS